MTDETQIDTDSDGEQEIEKIQASYGNVTVGISGNDAETVRETFDYVWETMMDTADKMHERNNDDDESGSRTFG
jgi:hypothetical protein